MNCDRIARWYRLLEYAAFGGALQRRRVAFLPELRTATRALVLGDGDGRFLNAFLRAAPQARVDAVEASARMLELTRERTAWAGSRVRLHCADARAFAFDPAAYDLIATHFFLDCFDDADLGRLTGRLAAAATGEARWAVSEFCLPGGRWARRRAAAWIGLLYRAFGWATGLRVSRLPDYRAALTAAGFVLEREEFACGGLLTSQWWRRRAAAVNRLPAAPGGTTTA